MAIWSYKPHDKPIIYQQNQQDFLHARRQRLCFVCKSEDGFPLQFEVSSPQFTCPSCDRKGVRIYDYLTVMAGRRFGKSFTGSIAGFEEALIPNTIGWACAPTVPKLHRYVIPAFEALIPKHLVKHWDKEFGDLRLTNGSLIHFQTLEDPDQGRGQGLDWLWIDEICELTRKHWDTIRPSLGDRRGVAFFTTTPRGYDWVYEDLFHPAEIGHDKSGNEVSGYWALHARSADSPAFMDAEGQAFLARERAMMSDLMYRQEYEADFVSFQGAIYGDTFTNDRILNDRTILQYIPEWPNLNPSRLVIVGLDSGYDHPFGAVKHVVTEHGIIVVDDYLERNKTFLEHANALKRMAPGPNVRWALNKNEAIATAELDQHGIRPIWLAENEHTVGIERVKTWLYKKQLFFHERCFRTIQQMKSYRWAENISPKDEQKKREQVYKKNDELPDATRYALMTWPALPREATPTNLGRDISNFTTEVQAQILKGRRLEQLAEASANAKEKDLAENFWSPIDSNELDYFG